MAGSVPRRVPSAGPDFAPECDNVGALSFPALPATGQRALSAERASPRMPVSYAAVVASASANSVAGDGSLPPLPVAADRLRPPPMRDVEDAAVVYDINRAEAQRSFQAMKWLFDDAERAEAHGQLIKAQVRRAEAYEERQRMQALHCEASARIFEERNRSMPGHCIDLHGQHCNEVGFYIDALLARLSMGEYPVVFIIVGAGSNARRRARNTVRETVRTCLMSYGAWCDVTEEDNDVRGGMFRVSLSHVLS